MLAVRLAEILIRDKIIPPEEAEIVKYGLENLASNFLGLCTTLLIGSCFGLLFESFILWLLAFPLRKNAGGFHAKTKGRCLIISMGMLIVSFVCLMQIKWPIAVYSFLAVLFFAVIFIMAPMGNGNKELDMVECMVYRKRTRLVAILQILLFMLALYCGEQTILIIITMSFSLVGVSLLMGKICKMCIFI